jgi:Flp pilus assembly protein TadD
MSTSNPPALDIGQTLGRAQAHWNAGHADQAEMACAQVLAVWPGQSDAMHLMGLMAHAYGNLDLAIANLRQACQSPRAPALYYRPGPGVPPTPTTPIVR